jgi:hypothetical protein
VYLLSGSSDDPLDARRELIDVLAPLEPAGSITPKGIALLSWARKPPGS